MRCWTWCYIYLLGSKMHPRPALRPFQRYSRKRYGTTDEPTDRRMDTPSYRDARTHLKTSPIKFGLRKSWISAFDNNVVVGLRLNNNHIHNPDSTLNYTMSIPISSQFQFQWQFESHSRIPIPVTIWFVIPLTTHGTPELHLCLRKWSKHNTYFFQYINKWGNYLCK